MTSVEPDTSAEATLPHAARRVVSAIEDPSVAEGFSGRSLVFLVLVTALAAVLRLWRLEDWSLWVDEAHTWRDITLPFDSFLGSERAWYPLSFLGLRALAEHGWLSTLEEGWLRLPFAFCGIISVPLLAVMGRDLVGRRCALLAALFLAINPWHIYFSQNVRGYVLVLFFAVLSAGTYWQGIARGSIGLRILGLVFAVLTGASHLTGLALFPVFVAYPMLDRMQRSGGRAWLWVLALGGLGLLIPVLLWWFPPFLSFHRAKADASFSHLMHTTAFYFRPPLVCAAIAGVWLMVRTRLQGRGLFLLCWLLVPLFAVGVLGSSFVKVTARYAFCSLPAVMLLAAVASIRLGEAIVGGLSYASLRSRIVPMCLLPLVLCLDMLTYDYLYFTTQHGDRAQWREASEAIRSAVGDQRFDVFSINEPSMLYYLRPDHFRGLAQDPHPNVRVWGINDWELGRGFPDYLKLPGGALPEGARSEGGCGSYLTSIEADVVRRKAALFFVLTRPELAEKDPSGCLLERLHQQCRLLQVFPCWVGPKDETIYVYQWVGR